MVKIENFDNLYDNLKLYKKEVDIFDKKRQNETEIVHQLKCDIRRQNAELNSLKEFLENLNFCAEKWRDDFDNLKYSKNCCDFETLMSILTLYLTARFPSQSYETRY